MSRATAMLAMPTGTSTNMDTHTILLALASFTIGWIVGRAVRAFQSL